MLNPYVASNFPRFPDDDYRTIDDRCLAAFRLAWDVPRGSVDPYTRRSGTKLGPIPAVNEDDLQGSQIRAVITNPPYRRPDVDTIHGKLIGYVADNTLDMAATLMRVQWDCAKSRAAYWGWPFAASIKLQFRPWWSENRAKQPIHSYQWLVWDRRHAGPPLALHAGAE